MWGRGRLEGLRRGARCREGLRSVARSPGAAVLDRPVRRGSPRSDGSAGGARREEGRGDRQALGRTHPPLRRPHAGGAVGGTLAVSLHVRHPGPGAHPGTPQPRRGPLDVPSGDGPHLPRPPRLHSPSPSSRFLPSPPPQLPVLRQTRCAT